MNTTFFTPQSKIRQSGMSLIEVVVAIVILSLGALGIAGLQARALKGNESSLQRTQAVISANYMLDLIRANDAFAIDMGEDNCVTAHATPAINTWLADMDTSMGEGASACGNIRCFAVGTTTQCDVTVRWDNSRAGAAIDNSDRVTLSSLL